MRDSDSYKNAREQEWTKNEKAEFKAKEVERVTQYRKRKQSDKPVPELSNVPLAQNPYKSSSKFQKGD